MPPLAGVNPRWVLLPYLALLQVGFTVPSLLPSPRCALTAPFHPCRAPSACASGTLGGLLSVALSVGSRPPGVTWHLIRRSPDFPPSRGTVRSHKTAITQPTPFCRLADSPADSLPWVSTWLFY